MPNIVPGPIAMKGDAVTVHVSGAATHPTIHSQAIHSIARMIESQNYLTLNSVALEENGATLVYTVSRNPLPIVLALVAFLSGGIATAGTAYTIDSVFSSGHQEGSGEGLFSFSNSTYVLLGLAVGWFVMNRVRA